LSGWSGFDSNEENVQLDQKIDLHLEELLMNVTRENLHSEIETGEPVGEEVE
jgi:antitoxin component of MazEF toxin-antitoxin module